MGQTPSFNATQASPLGSGVAQILTLTGVLHRTLVNSADVFIAPVCLIITPVFDTVGVHDVWVERLRYTHDAHDTLSFVVLKISSLSACWMHEFWRVLAPC